jgi:hypothetical protein
MNDTIVNAAAVPYQVSFEENTNKSQVNLVGSIRNIITSLDDKQLGNEKISNEAGSVAKSSFIDLDKAIKNLYFMITKNQNDLVKSQLRVEQTVSSAQNNIVKVETTKDKPTIEYLEMMMPIMEQLSTAIKSTSKTLKTMDVIDRAYETSEFIIKTMFKNAPKSAEMALNKVTDGTERQITMVTGFNIIEEAFSISLERLNQTKKELEYAQQSGNDIVIGIAKRKLEAAEFEKNEIKSLRDAAYKVSEEFKLLINEIEETIEIVKQQVVRLNQEMENIDKLNKENVKKKGSDALKRLRAINYIV